jgi:hypothetical protein
MKMAWQSLRGRLRAVPKPLAFYLLFLVGGVVLLRMDPFGLTRLTNAPSDARMTPTGWPASAACVGRP